MMAHLAGLNDALHGFSARAWALATTIVDSPTLCARLGTDARVLRLEELAELVQVVLEETESPDLHAWAPETGSQAPPRGAGTTAQRGPGSKSPGLRTEPARPGAARSRRQPTRPLAVAAGAAAAHHQIRRLLRDIRAAVQPDEAGADAPGMGHVHPGALGYRDLGIPEIAGASTASGAAAPRAMPLSAALSARFRAADRASARRLDPAAQHALTMRGPAWTSGAHGVPIGSAGLPRALQLNEAATELAFLAPANEVADDFAAPVTQRAAPAERTTSARDGAPGAGMPLAASAARGSQAGWGADAVPGSAGATDRVGVASAAKGLAPAPRLAQVPHRTAPAGITAAHSLPAAPRRALTAAVAAAAAAQRRLAGADHLAGLPHDARGVGIGDAAEARVAAMTPRWLDTLHAWADADTGRAAVAGAAAGVAVSGGAVAGAPSLASHRRALGAARPASAGQRREAAMAQAEMVALTPGLEGEAATTAAGPNPHFAGTPRWFQRTEEPAHGAIGPGAGALRAAAAGPVGLRADALTQRLVARHGAGLAAPETAESALRSWGAPRAGYRASTAERTTVAWPEEVGAAAAAASSPGAVPTGAAHQPAARRPAPVAFVAAAAVAAVAAQSRQRLRQTASGLHAKTSGGVWQFALGAVASGAASAGLPMARGAGGPRRAVARAAGRSPERHASAGVAGELAWLHPETALSAAGETPAAALPHARVLAAGATGALVPAALRAALAVFGAHAADAAPGSVASAYLSRFFGRAEATAKPRRPLDLARPTLELRDFEAAAVESSVAKRPTGTREIGRAPAAAQPATHPDGPVLRGMAALDALLAGPAATDARLAHAALRDMRTADAEQTLLQPGVERPLESPAAETVAVRAPVAQAAWPSARLHSFAPVGLGRGRGLLNRRPAGGAVLGARASNARPSGAASWTSRRVAHSGQMAAGYGAAALGGGELLGLGGGDAAGFFGEAAATPHALHGADALAGWVTTRRGGAPIRGHAAAVAGFSRETGAGEFVQPSQADFGALGDSADLGPRGMPSHFNVHQAAAGASTYAQSPQATLIEAGGVAARQAQAMARATGPTASARANQAGAMARVLSVTDSPTGNMLPLVAPAAHAVVTAAAAKPQSEHIVTSGYGPSQGMSGQSIQGAGHADGAHGDAGHASDEGAGHDAQDVDALAAKIARSVLLRMQRERERRGQYG